MRGRNGLRVLSSRPAETEYDLAHVGLGDLLEDVLDEVLPTLTLPRRRALEVALLRDEAPGERVDRRALAVALRDVLQLLGEREPILVAVDDVQWLDASSAGALAFALRRLAPSRVLVLLARRLAPGTAAQRRTELERALAPEDLQRLPVGPLSAGALHRVLLDRLGRPFARQTLLRIHERSDGNPFFALELARALDADVDPLEPLPVPETLDELLRARIAGFPASTHEALALVAALGTTSDSFLARAGVAPDALEPAVAAHVIARDAGAIRFTHPLLSSVVYRDLGDERRRVHARIARLVDDPVLRALHVALSQETHGCRRCGRARRRRRTGRRSRRVRRRGRARRARPSTDSGRSARGAPRAARSPRLGRIRAPANGRAPGRSQPTSWPRPSSARCGPRRSSSFRSSRTPIARSSCSTRPCARRARVRRCSRPFSCRLAWAGRFQGGMGHARSALELADEVDDDALRVRARAVQAVLSWFAGEPDGFGGSPRSDDASSPTPSAATSWFARRRRRS